MPGYKLIVKNAKVILKTVTNAVLNISGIKDLLTGSGSVDSNNKIDWTLQEYTNTAANFTSNNPILLLGQKGIETDDLLTAPKFKIGNGVTAWNTLPYANIGGGGGGGDYLQIVSKDITDSAALTGTTAITLMKSILIPANTYATGDVVKLLNRAIRNTATGTAINYFYINTTNSLTGATLAGSQAGVFSWFGMERSLYIKSTTVSETINNTTSPSGSEVGATVNGNLNLNINWGVNQYIIAAFQNAAVGNSTVMSSLIIQKF
jgi:hypothetical protein